MPEKPQTNDDKIILRHPKGSSSYFIIRNGSKEVEATSSPPETEPKFQTMLFNTTKLGHDINPKCITVTASNLVKCHCDKNECPHDKEINVLATNIVRHLISENVIYSKYWVIGDCFIKIPGKMTDTQFQAYSLPKSNTPAK